MHLRPYKQFRYSKSRCRTSCPSLSQRFLTQSYENSCRSKILQVKAAQRQFFFFLDFIKIQPLNIKIQECNQKYPQKIKATNTFSPSCAFNYCYIPEQALGIYPGSGSRLSKPLKLPGINYVPAHSTQHRLYLPTQSGLKRALLTCQQRLSICFVLMAGSSQSPKKKKKQSARKKGLTLDT